MARVEYVAVADYNANYNCGTQLVMTSDAIFAANAQHQHPDHAKPCVTPGNAGSIPQRLHN